MKLFPLFEETDWPTDALIGQVSAGEPIEIGSEFEQIDLNYLLTHGNPYCMLIKVRGDSMSEEIHDGDWVMIDRSREAKPGDIVLAQIDGGFTLKRQKLNDRRGRSGLYLVPANQIYKTRQVTEDDGFELVGVVTHIIRSTV